MRFFFFFFSSRRRHTRLQGDWSSDVCSSDLVVAPKALPAKEPARLGKKTLRGGDREASTGDEPQGGRSRLWPRGLRPDRGLLDRKSTRLNSSHLVISYAVFCLKKKKKRNQQS